MDRIDPALPIDRIDPLEPIERIESWDLKESKLSATGRFCLQQPVFGSLNRSSE